ncbi:hypothetical protein P5V15_008921 [Pogonomyrmex californicus]
MACLRLDIYAKKQLWQINYDCINISTELPTMSDSNTMRMTDTAIEETSMSESGQSPVTTMTTELMTTSNALTTESMTASNALTMESMTESTMQTSDMNSTGTSERLREVEDITDIFEIIPQGSIPIK